MKYLKAFKPKLLQGAADVYDWNRKKLPFLVAHAASAGHGLNMQDGGDYVGWFGVPWNLEQYQQANKRVHRQGRQHPVFMRKYITLGTMDEDVVLALDHKASGQEALMQAVKARIEKYRS
jgi:SNF2 family DNA or RNA helicase